MRTVTINGKSIALETGKAPCVNQLAGRGRVKSEIRLICEAMRDGESAYLPITPGKEWAAKTSILANTGKALGCRFSYRAEGAGVRLYRLAGKVGNRHINSAAKPNGARQPDYVHPSVAAL